MSENPRTRLIAYSIAVLGTAACLLVRWPLWPMLGTQHPYVTFLPAVFLSSYYGGFRPGLLAALLGALGMQYFLIEPLHAFPLEKMVHVSLVYFPLVGVILFLNESLIKGRKAEQALLQSEQRWRSLAESLPQLVWSARPDGACDYFSTQWTQHTGVSEADLLGWRWLEVLHPDDRERTRKFWTDSVAGRGPYDVEYRVRRKDGEYRWFKTRGVPLRDGGDQILKWFGTCTDITADKQLEKELRQANERLNLGLRGSNVAVWAFDMPDGRIENSRLTFINVWRLLGYESDEGPTDFARAFALGVHEDDQEGFRHAVNEFLASDGHEFAYEYRIRRKDSSVGWYLTRGAALRDSAGKPIRLNGSTIEITQLKRAEEALRESEHRWRSLTEALPQLVWIATPDGNCEYFSSQWTQHTGILESELLGWRWLEALHPDDREVTRQAWTAAVQGPGVYDVEYRVRRKDGQYRWFKTRGVPIRDGNGHIFKWFGTCTDITASKQLEVELRQASARLDLAVRASNIAVWEFVIPDGVLENAYLHGVNVEAQLGFERDELPTSFVDWVALIHPDDRKKVTNSLEASLADKRGEFEVEYRVRHKDGAYRWLLSRGVTMWNDAGKPIHATGTRVDITERRRAEDQLRQLKDAAEAANRAKDEFLANVSHEIRTPMNAILGLTELVLDTPLTDDQRQSLKTVKSAADNLLSIINDLLDFSKIEAGKLELDLGGFSLRDAVGDILRALAVRAHRKGLELISHVQPDVPDALVGDPGRLRQVLLNLVGNAIKFTDEGEVVVRVEVAGDASPEGEVALHFAVCDTGIGIPPDKQGAIFRAFEQEDTSTTRKYGGTGLGLTIAARLVELMGGQIGVDSMPGRGSTFIFTARFGRQPNPSGPVAPPPPVLLRNLPVLIVDDNATNRHILQEWLRDWQLEAQAVGDAAAAMDALWHRTANGRPYALALLDVRMPDRDGLTLAAMIQERTELSATRLILLTSGDRPGDAAQFRELRIDAHLLKPVQREELLETIYRVMTRPTTSGPTPVRSAPSQEASTTPAATRPLKILVAEDNEFSARLMDQLITRRGHCVRPASNGREALALAEKGSFDVLLLDIHMPEMDGFEIIDAIRERERSAGGHLPVVALTARSRKEDRDRCLAAGMDDFLTKPVNAAALFAAIDRLMFANAASQSAPEKKEERSGLLDPVAVLTACGGDADGLRMMCSDFETYATSQLADVRDALRDRDAPRLRQAAHKICPLLFAFSTVAGNVASNLEDLAAQDQLEKAQPLVDQLETMTQELIRLVGGLSLASLRDQSVDHSHRE
jgi:two-component system sensor histidine kinase/response regulator